MRSKSRRSVVKPFFYGENNRSTQSSAQIQQKVRAHSNGGSGKQHMYDLETSHLKIRPLLRVLHNSWISESQLSLTSVIVDSRAVLNTDTTNSFRDVSAGRIGIAVGEQWRFESLLLYQRRNDHPTVTPTFAISSGEKDTRRPNLHHPMKVGKTSAMQRISTPAAAPNQRRLVW